MNLWVQLALAVAGCSSDAPSSGTPDASAEGGGGASPDDAGVSGGGAGDVVDCSGEFSAPQLILSAVPPNILRAPAVTRGELELFFVEAIREDGPESFMRSVRRSKSERFPAGQVVEEFNAACADRPVEDVYGIDVSADGLRAYVTCNSTNELNELRFFTRANRASDFQLSHSVGQMGSSISVDARELVAFSSGYNPYPSPPLSAERATPSDNFEEPTPILGLESLVLVAPDLSPDGLTLYGAENGNVLGFVTRPGIGGMFGAFSPISGVELSGAGAPEISADCKTLYFIGIEYGSASNDAGSLEPLWGIYAMRR